MSLDYLVVKDLPSLDGKYEFSLDDLLSVGAEGSLTNREVHELKRMAQVRLGELEDALLAGDNSVYIAIAAILLRRKGKYVDEELLWDAPAGASISFDFEAIRNMKVERAPDVDPPTVPAEEPAANKK